MDSYETHELLGRPVDALVGELRRLRVEWCERGAERRRGTAL